jgi:hypothetical protein
VLLGIREAGEIGIRVNAASRYFGGAICKAWICCFKLERATATLVCSVR